jgi:hypothetical protein
LAFLFVDISLRPAAVRTLAHSRGATDQTSRSSFFDHILEEGFVYKDSKISFVLLRISDSISAKPEYLQYRTLADGGHNEDGLAQSSVEQQDAGQRWGGTWDHRA